jgi:hypothetical protein
MRPIKIAIGIDEYPTKTRTLKAIAVCPRHLLMLGWLIPRD